MKRIICAFLACLLLCGCAGPAAETTEPTHLPAVAPTEPSGSYEPGSEIELATGGAVRAYPQNLGNIRMIKAVGEDLLVFSDGETTQITRLTGENLFRIAEIRLDKHCSRFYVGEEQVIYYDSETRELVYLNQDLRETNRMAVPEDMVGEPVLTSDRMRLYYCTASGVRCLETETGISRLVKEMTFSQQYMMGIHMGDTVLQVEVMDEKGNRENLFLDAESGALMGTLPENMALTTGTAYFYAIDPEGVVNQMIFGTEEKIWQLTPENYLDCGVFLPEVHAAVVFDRENEALTLDYYDLSIGLRTSSLNLEGIHPESIAADGKGRIYLLAEGAIYQWDLTATSVADETVYTGPRYTMDAPDMEGLRQCRDFAEKLQEQYGLEIEIISDAVNMKPSDYDLIPEYQVPVIMDALTQLEKILTHYPEGMFEKSVENLENGELTLCLVREIRGSYESGNLDSVDGLHFWLDEHSYVAVSMGDNLEATFYHEMFHALESRLLSESIALYRWDELNPKGFDYDYDYIANQSRDGSEYLEDTTRSFIDTYSMSFPKEDRARVMEYACMPGNENYFISYTMQKKLLAICEGIREAYGLEDYPEPLLWEQYLESSITP